MSDSNNKHSISLTKKQYFTLMKAAYLGNWLANAHHDGKPGNERNKEIEDAENIILSFAKQFGFDKYVDDELADEGQYFPTRIFDETLGLMEIIEEYDDNTFWDKIVERLAQRDFERQYSLEKIRQMTDEDRINKLYVHIDKWAEEINTNSLDNITINEKKK